MDLWIRSQAGEMLFKAKGLKITSHNGNRYFIECNEHAVAVYATKQRAIKVLNEIHQRLLNLQLVEITPEKWKTIKGDRFNLDCVYTMPKE